MTDLFEQLNDWTDSIEDMTNLSITDQLEITQAGAKAYQKGLTDITRTKHFQHNEGVVKNSKGEIIGHLADSVIVSGKNIDGIKNGNATVGFNKQHARIARLLNNGWRYKSHGKLKTKAGDSFIENSRVTLQQQIAEAEYAKAKEILNKK